jgi:hypothetical protein
VHKAEVRVREASINARAVLVGHNLSSAHRDKRTSQGDIKLTLALARAVRGLRLSLSNAASGLPGTALGSGSGNLRAKVKTATLHCLRFDPVCPDMQ